MYSSRNIGRELSSFVARKCPWQVLQFPNCSSQPSVSVERHLSLPAGCVTLPSEYVGYASEFETHTARVTTATIAERINTLLTIVNLLPFISVDEFPPFSPPFNNRATPPSKNTRIAAATRVPGALVGRYRPYRREKVRLKRSIPYTADCDTQDRAARGHNLPHLLGQIVACALQEWTSSYPYWVIMWFTTDLTTFRSPPNASSKLACPIRSES